MLGQHRGLRLRPGSGPKLLGAAAGAVLVVALVVSGSPATYPPGPCHLRPSQLPGHPDPPARDATAVACDDTIAAATAAGYPEAPLPAGALELDGVYLRRRERDTIVA
jgi:hypothetical protein